MFQPVPALSLQNASVAYGNIKVVDDVSLDVGDGECVGLIGLNGAGKTSLIKSIVGLRRPLAGAFRIFGKEVGDRHLKRKFSYLPERFDPPPFLTGREFIRFSLRLYGVEVSEDEVLGWADAFQLAGQALDRPVSAYSKGMRQKLGLISCLASGAPLAILDEPMSGLDPLARLLTKEALVKGKASGKTLFLSSHILVDMQEICDRVVVLLNGKFVFSGSPEGLCAAGGDRNIEKAFLNIMRDAGGAGMKAVA